MLNQISKPILFVASIATASLLIAAEKNSPINETEILSGLLNRYENQAATSVLFLNDADRQVAFKNTHLLNPTRLIPASESPLQFGSNPMDLAELSYELDGQTYTLSDFTAMSANRGILVVKDGDIAYEHYSPGNDKDTRWISFSVSKSVTSLLIGAAINDGYIESVDEPVVNYLPRLRGSGYEDVTIKNILQMSSGVAWNEDYADPNSDVARAGALNGIELVSYLATLPSEHPPGEMFNYNTGETNLVGEVLRAAIGNNAATYLTHKIWQPFGMGDDANWMLSFEGGGETGGCCISATLRDYARIGMFVLNDGQLADGTRVVPEGWIEESMTPSRGAPYYGYLWWLMDDAYRAIGIFEQHIVMDPEKNLVIAIHSNAPAATGSDYSNHVDAVSNAIRAAL